MTFVRRKIGAGRHGIAMNLVNGAESDAIGVSDRGFMYGDGVFRTLLVREGQPLLWSRHYAKLASDCAALGIACPLAGVLERDLAKVAARSPAGCVVRITITRGSGARGYATPAAAAPLRVVATSPLPDHPRHYFERGVRARICRLRLAAQPALAGVKHLNRLENVLARAEWSDPEVAEGLLCDTAGNVVGGTMSNLFVVRGGSLATPELRHCGVAGVQRELVIELARANRIPLRIASVSLDELRAADEIFLVNSVIGVWQIAELDDRTWNPGPVTAEVRRWIEHAQGCRALA